jgi:hypothetical protein
VDVAGSETATPPGVKFPGAYSLQEPSIKANSYFGVDVYTPPGPPIYQGIYEAPQGLQPVVTETGADPCRDEFITKVETQLRQSFGRVNQHLGVNGPVEKGTPKTGIALVWDEKPPRS